MQMNFDQIGLIRSRQIKMSLILNLSLKYQLMEQIKLKSKGWTFTSCRILRPVSEEE